MSLLFALIYALTPPGADDLLFMKGTKGVESLAGRIGMLPDLMAYRWASETGRFGTMFSLVSLNVMPRWLFGLLSGGVLFLLFRYCVKAARVEAGSLLSWLLFAVIVFALPWYDYLFLETYSLNYVWGGCFAVMTVWFFYNARTYGGLKLAGACAVAFLAGWTHEAYGAPLLFGATLYAVLRRREISRQELCVGAALGLGMLVIFLSPTFWTRAGGEPLILKFPLKEAVIQLGPSLLLFLVFVVSLVCGVAVKSWRRRLREAGPELALFGGFVAASLGVTLLFYCGPRSAMPLLLFSAVGAAFVFGRAPRNASGGVALTAGLVFSAVAVVHLCYAAVMQRKCLREYEEIVRLYAASADGTFYYDLTYPRLDGSLFKTSVRQFHESSPLFMWRVYYDTEKYPTILPTGLRGFRPAAATRALSPGAMMYDGWIVLDDEGRERLADVVRLKVVTADGRELVSRYRAVPFKADDGREYVLIVPHVKTLDEDLAIENADFSPGY